MSAHLPIHPSISLCIWRTHPYACMHARLSAHPSRLTPPQLEKTFVLNFGKKGELKDEIKEIKVEISTEP